MNKKILMLGLILTLAVPLAVGAKKRSNSPNPNNENNASFLVTSVEPATVENNKDTGITITGSGFSGIGDIRAKLGAWEDDKRDTTDDSALLTNVSVVDDTTITATVPAGTHAQNDQSLTVYDSGDGTHYTLLKALSVHPSFSVNDTDTINPKNQVMEVYQSGSSSSKANFSLTVLGKSFKNKRWLKVRVGNRKAVITKVTRSGNDSIVQVKFRYGKMADGKYNISFSYKERLKKGIARRNKVTYRNIWEKGTITVNDSFEVMLQPIQ